MMQLARCIILALMIKQEFYNFFSLYKKMSETSYYQRNREVILHRAKDYYENNK